MVPAIYEGGVEHFSGKRCAARIVKLKIQLARSSGVIATRAVYVGDSRVDREAAESAGVNFIGVGNRIEHSRMIPTVADLQAALELLNASLE